MFPLFEENKIPPLELNEAALTWLSNNTWYTKDTLLLYKNDILPNDLARMRACTQTHEAEALIPATVLKTKGPKKNRNKKPSLSQLYIT